MGIARKLLSASTLGAVDYRSDKERTARSTRRMDKGIRKQNRLLAIQNRRAAWGGGSTPPVPTVPPAWMASADQPEVLRWWDGQQWTDHVRVAA